MLRLKIDFGQYWIKHLKTKSYFKFRGDFNATLGDKLVASDRNANGEELLLFCQKN